ncbi:MAG: DNA translocase FtsK [Ardenticatenaceae bacterium]|nr:DNA translocase FtsK [Ardenticatenaceae bacterium]MCB8987021.1 DNA translocase FtsK [Ardenticatenaceae bacterium]
MTTSRERRRMLQQERLRHRYEIQSRQIERVFARHKMLAQVEGGAASQSSIRFDLQTQLVTGWERLRDLAGDLKTALGVPNVALSHEGGRWQLDVAFKESPPVALLDMIAMTPNLPPLTAVMGLSEDGRPVLLQFDPKDMTHMMISGDEGAGKTSLIRTMALSLALTNRQSNVQLLILAPETEGREPAYTELEPLNFLPHMLTSVVYDMETAVEVLHFLANEMAYREANDVSVPNLLAFVDQAAKFMENGGAPVVDALTHLVQRGHKSGIHLVLSTERPEAEVFDANMRANLTVRVVGRVGSRQAARNGAGLEDSGAENLLGSGDFIAITGGRLIGFQAAFIGDYDLHLSLTRLRRPPTPTLMAHSYFIRPHLDDVMADGSLENTSDDEGMMFFDANGRTRPQGEDKR